MVLPEALRKKLEAQHAAGNPSMQKLQGRIYEFSAKTPPRLPATPQRAADEHASPVKATPVREDPTYDLGLNLSEEEPESPNLGENTVAAAQNEPARTIVADEAVIYREIPVPSFRLIVDDTRAGDVAMEDIQDPETEVPLLPRSQEIILAPHASPAPLRSIHVETQLMKKGGGKSFLFKPKRPSSIDIGRISTFCAGSSSQAPRRDGENEEEDVDSPDEKSMRDNDTYMDSLPEDMLEYFAGADTVEALRQRTAEMFQLQTQFLRETRVSAHHDNADVCERLDHVEAKMTELMHAIHELVENDFQDDTGPLEEYVRDVELNIIRQHDRMLRVREWVAAFKGRRNRARAAGSRRH